MSLVADILIVNITVNTDDIEYLSRLIVSLIAIKSMFIFKRNSYCWKISQLKRQTYFSWQFLKQFWQLYRHGPKENELNLEAERIGAKSL